MGQWERTIRIIGEEKIKHLRDASVIVLGIGGVGSFVCEGLARGGIGHLTLVDFDTVSETNLNRQLVALHSTLGKKKVDVMAQRILDICPDTEVTCLDCFLTPENIHEIFSKHYDYVVDAIDNVTAKIALITYCSQHDIPVISSMGTGNKLHPELFEITDIYKTSVCPLAKVMRKKLKENHVPRCKVLYSKEEPIQTGMREPGSISFTPSIAGLLIAGEVIRNIMGD